MSILTLESINKSYMGKAVLEDINLSLERGGHLGLIGSNGTGKTTLLRIIAGVEEADGKARVQLASGTQIAYLQQELSDAESDALTLSDPEIARLEQKLRQLELEMEKSPENQELLGAYAKASANFEALGGWDFRYRLASALAGLGLSQESFSRPLHSLSGGERMRAALARILLRNPDLLLLDEPTNHLDSDAIEWLENYLSQFKGALIVVSHDRHFLDEVTEQTAQLRNRHLRLWSGNYTSFKAAEKEENIRLQNERKKLQQKLEHESEVAQTLLSHRKMVSYHSRERKVKKLSEELEELKKQNQKEKASLRLKFLANEDRGDPERVLIRAINLSVQFPDSETPLFQPIRLVICGREKLLICGPNGCGKTNLLKALAAENPYLQGDVYLSSGLRYAFMGQWSRFEDETKSVFDTLCDASNGASVQGVQSTLAQFGFYDNDLLKKTEDLSGGEKARLALACILMEKPDLLFLDEPTNHLDISSKEILESALKAYDGTIVAVSHDRYFIENIADRILGFTDEGPEFFESYRQYRQEMKRRSSLQAVKNGEDKAADKTLSPDAKSLFSPEARALFPDLNRVWTKSANKAESRRYRAWLKEQTRAVENAIAEAEAYSSELEARFSEDEGGKIYHEYAGQEEKINLMLELYGQLGDLLAEASSEEAK